ncbi:MAG: 3-dehydroquinate synthase [Nitrospinae bacterium]|nr:3-dehydroquinate synthase [Nitrospinota bacterium]
MKKLKIDLAERSYEILIGRNLLGRTGEFLRDLVKGNSAVVVTHPGIRRLYGDGVTVSLQKAGFRTAYAEVAEGEASKSLEVAGRLFDRLVEFGCDRQSVLVALGGGVVGDLTGFVAATFMRGVPFVQVPTTLLAQVDSSVGGKTAVNHPRGKNLIGAFYQPRAVIVDVDTLKTLPFDEFRAGMAEVVKYGVIADRALFDFIDDNASAILALDPACLERIVETSCAIKAGVVEKDERESRYRMVLNFGHTIGHAVEALTGYSGMKHGEAVAVGMVYAAELSKAAGYCSEDVCRRLRALIRKLGLPDKLPDLGPAAIVEAMYLDKKATDRNIRFVLVKDIGEVEITDGVPEPVLRKVLEN